MLGHYNSASLAGVGISGTLIWSITMIIQSLSMGISAAASRSYGEKNQNALLGFVGTSFVFMMILSSIVLISIIGFENNIIGFFALKGNVLKDSKLYLFVTAFGIPFISMAFILHSVMESLGDTVNPMKIVFFANLINIVFNYVLIFGKFGFPELGIKGAALASVLAQFFQFFLAFIILIKKNYKIKIKIKNFIIFKISYFKRLMNISIPAFIEQLVFQSGYIFFTKIVATLGEKGIAAHRTALSLESLSFMPAVGFSVAASTLVGQYIGKKKIKSSVVLANKTAFLGLIFLTIIAGTFLMFPKFLITIFSKDPEIIKLGAMAVFIGAFEQPFLALSIIYGGALRGAGDTKTPMFVSMISSWLIRVPLVYYLVIILKLGINGVWIGTFFDWLFRAIALVIFFRFGRWKKIKI